jgi:hypothetical protein
MTTLLEPARPTTFLRLAANDRAVEVGAISHVGRHARPVLPDPAGELPLATYGVLVAVCTAVTLLGRVWWGEVGALTGAIGYVVVTALAGRGWSRASARSSRQ